MQKDVEKEVAKEKARRMQASAGEQREREREREKREKERERERERERDSTSSGKGLNAQIARTHPSAILKYDEGASCSRFDTKTREYVVSIEREGVGRGRGSERRQNFWSCIWQGYIEREHMHVSSSSHDT